MDPSAALGRQYASQMITHTVGAVLAGGHSSRMGTDKAALEYQDAAFIDHILATMSIVLSDVVVCGGTHEGRVPVLTDSVENAGPLGGLLAALDHADGRPVVIVPTDMPLVSVELITRLADPELVGSGVRVARADDQIQPLCAAYGSDIGAVVRARLERSQRSAMGLIESLTSVDYIDTDSHTLTNINTPQEYAALTEAWQQ
jgi:molybdopterin-guanine dinucleotide biosynthesis protein A